MSDAIAGAVHTLRLLADGSIAVTLHFEPKDRVAVMTLMGQPGAPIACVRLKDGYAQAGEEKPAARTWADKGPLEKEAIELCKAPRFLDWLQHLRPKFPQPDAEAARSFILGVCGVQSRKDLDTAEGARDVFIEMVRKPYLAWLGKQR